MVPMIGSSNVKCIIQWNDLQRVGTQVIFLVPHFSATMYPAFITDIQGDNFENVTVTMLADLPNPIATGTECIIYNTSLIQVASGLTRSEQP